MNLQAPVQRQSRLLSLPTELQILNFDLAYSRSSDIKLIDKHLWRSQERERKRSAPSQPGYTIRPFPEAKILSFMVSKAFLDMAASAFIGTQAVDLSQFTPTPNSIRSLLWVYARDLIVDIYAFWKLERCVRLKKLTFKMRPCQIDDAARQSAIDADSDEIPETNDWSLNKRLSADDFRKLTSLNTYFRPVGGLTAFNIISDSLFRQLSKEQQENSDANLRTCENSVRSKVLAAKSASSQVHVADGGDHKVASMTHGSDQAFQSGRSGPAPPPLTLKDPRRLTAISVENEEQATSPPAPPKPHAKPSFANQIYGPSTIMSKHTDGRGRGTKRLPVSDFLESLPKRRKVAYANTPAGASEHSPSSPSVDCLVSTAGSLSPSPVSISCQPLSKTGVNYCAPQAPQNSKKLYIFAEPSLSAVLPQLERLLDENDPEPMSWIRGMKAKGKL